MEAGLTPGMEAGWTLEQEVALLEAVEQTGPGSWAEVAGMLGSQRSPAQLRDHFTTVYVDGRCPAPALARASFAAVNPCLPPPRPALDTALPAGPARDRPPRPGLARAAAYSAARGEFCLPPDPRAEAMLAPLETEPEGRLEQELQAAVAGAYSCRLGARARLARRLAEHGLLARRGQTGRLLASRGQTGRRNAADDGAQAAWARFAGVMCAMDLAWVVAGLRAERRLRARVLRLQQLRRHGLSTLGSAAVLETLQRRRREHAAALQVPGGAGRPAAAPLDILGLPACELLSEGERALSSELRLEPAAFARLRGVLAAESDRRGGLLLAQARGLLRIDVNKTRRIFDLLASEGTITARLQEWTAAQ